MSAQFTVPLVTVIPGQLIASSLWNNEWNNLNTNFIPAGMDSYSDTDAQMQIQTAPFPGSVTSHAANLGGEIERIRFQIAAITGKSFWYNAPDLDIGNIVNSLVPVGGVIDYPAASSPNTNYHLADGTAIDRTIYATLFTLIGTTFGIGDGTTTFNLPDYRDRMSIGAGTSYAAAATGGATTHTHTQTGHSHTVNSHAHTIAHQHDTAVGNLSTTGYLDAAWSGGTSSRNNTFFQFAMAGAGPSPLNYFKTSDTLTANSGAATPGTDTQTPAIASASNLAPYLGMYKMIRVL